MSSVSRTSSLQHDSSGDVQAFFFPFSFKQSVGHANSACAIFVGKMAAKHLRLRMALPESIMEACSVVLTFESVDEILWCDHSNETSSAVLGMVPFIF